MVEGVTESTPLHLRIALTVPEAAELVGLSAPTIRRLIADKKLARVPDTDRVIIARLELERWATGTAREVAA